ncbi:MAG: hypothetical protein M3N98_05505, partial [Actinomycetota bacterium]|nr:hypothetical protein [Actinomycetota bacterium]
SGPSAPPGAAPTVVVVAAGRPAVVDDAGPTAVVEPLHAPATTLKATAQPITANGMCDRRVTLPR